MTGIHHKQLAAFVALISGGVVGFAFAGACVAIAVEPDIPRLQSAAAKGSVQQEIELGAAYLTGRGVARDEKQAAYWYEKAANAGDPAAQNQIGFFYQTGIGVKRNLARAVQWYERSMAGGSQIAKVNLGVAYMWGIGIRKDPTLAVQLFREAAKKGSGEGATYLGVLYYSGTGVPKDTSEAMHWFEVGSKLHNAIAEHDLALMLLQRTDRASHDRAIDLLRESAVAGYVEAMHQLGLEITKNPSYARSPRENVDLLEGAASNGFWKSSFVLGVLARDGRGVAKDSKEAYYHFRIAALQGGDPALVRVQSDIARLKTTLGKEEIRNLDLQAAEWTQKHNEHLQFVNLRGGERSYPALVLGYPEKGDHAGTLISIPAPDSFQSIGDPN
jgi:TPR repeat protein